MKLLTPHTTLLTAAIAAIAAAAALPTFAARPEPPPPPTLSSIMMREAPVEYAMWVLGEAWRRHIVVNEAAKQTQVRLFLRDIDCMSALKAICHANGLWFKEDPESGIIYVETTEEYIRGSRLNDKKFIEVVTVVHPRVEDIGSSLQEVFRDMVVYANPDYENGDESEDISRALSRLDQLSALSTIVDNASGGSSLRSSSRNSSRSAYGSSSMRNNRNRSAQNLPGFEPINDYYDDVDRLNRRRDLVVPDAGGEPQALNPGVVFVAAVRRSNTILLRSSDPESIKQVREVIAELDRPKPQVLLEVKVLSLDVTDEKQRMIDLLYWSSSGRRNAGFAENLVDLPSINSEGATAPLIGALGVAGAAFDSRAFVFQAMHENIQSRIRILDSNGKIERLATPSLMVADLEASRIFVGDETTLLTSVETSVTATSGDNPVIMRDVNAQTERRDIGTTLVITPKIHADQTVTIRIMQENARIGQTKLIVYGTDGSSFESSDITKQTISSTVMAKSGEMIALGGLMTRTRQDTVSRIPILADIPILGKLFERKNVVDIETELIVLIRPYVMLTPDMAERLSQRFVTRSVKTSSLLGEAMDKGDESEIDTRIMEIINSGVSPIATPLD